MSGMLIRPAKALRGEIPLAGDKSISHRAAILSAMAVGETRIDNFAESQDCRSTLECLRRLRVEIGRDGRAIVVRGVGKSGFLGPDIPLDCGNSGTTMRLLAGVLAGQSFDSVLTGDDSLCRRPMNRVIEPLEAMGAVIGSDNGNAPLDIHGRRPLAATHHRLKIASAQIKSCILLAGLNSDGETSVTERIATRDHTERMLRWFGVDVDEKKTDEGTTLSVNGKSLLSARDIRVPSDISSAVFFMVAAACLAGSDISIPGVGLNPTRSDVIGTLQHAGALISLENEREQSNEPVGDIRVSGGLTADGKNVINGDAIAGLIDELPALAVLGTQLQAGLEVRDAGELRVKESDRIAAIVENLRRMGANVEEFDDGFRVRRSHLTGARVESFGDHRIAMAFAVAGLLAEGETEIDGAECAAVSFPGFFDVLENVAIYE
ncbi:MAG TPA: 3-phosphoshikimate 1-carboxyvinyltransferase [Pyrinomonadaceae bacterium]